jgi:uncharacterized protein with HEPN domain
MKRSDAERLCDTRAFARHAQTHASGLTADALAEAIKSRHAALYDLAIVGETLNQVSVEVKKAAPDIEWRRFYELRNFIVHAYWQIDLEVVAAVIRERLEPLIAELDTLIAFVERMDR